MAEYRQGWTTRAAQEPDDEIIKSGVNPDNIRLVFGENICLLKY
jgi:hypothetical protein